MSEPLKKISFKCDIAILTCIPLFIAFFGCGCQKPSHRESTSWELRFRSPENELVVIHVRSNELNKRKNAYAGLVVVNNDDYSCVANESSNLTNTSPLRRRIVNQSAFIAEPEVSGSFQICEEVSGEEIHRIRTGHSYSKLLGLSPCAKYVIYAKPGAYSVPTKVILHGVDNLGRAPLNVSPTSKLESWVEINN